MSSDFINLQAALVSCTSVFLQYGCLKESLITIYHKLNSSTL